MSLPTEPIGSIPRTPALIEAMQAFGAGRISQADLDRAGDDAVRDTIAAFEATGSPVITDGEQTKPSFATYPLSGLTEPGAGRRHDPVRRRPHPAASSPDRGTVPLRDVRRQLHRRGAPSRSSSGQAGGDRAVGAEPALSGGRYSRVPARGLSRGSETRGRVRHPPGARRGRVQRAAGFHGRAPGSQAGSEPRPAAGVHRAQQRGAGEVQRHRTPAPRRPHMPRRRSGLHAQRRRGLRATCCRTSFRCRWGTSTSSSPASGIGRGCWD